LRCWRSHFLILAIALAALLVPCLTDAMIAIGITQMPVFARLNAHSDLVGQAQGLR
jgi:ABC-type dipeptide/oligopeptide/nickel transport system permease subunit